MACRELKVDKRWVVAGGHVHGTVLLPTSCVSEAGGLTFVKMQKSTNTTSRLLGFKSCGKVRHLARTDIIEQMCDARDEEYPKFCIGYAMNDLGMNDEKPKKLKPKAAMPSWIGITTPEFPDIESIEMKVKLTRPSSVLHIEINEANLDYMASVAKYQVEEMDIKRMHPAASIDDDIRMDTKSECPGVFFCHSGRLKGKWKVVYHDPDDDGDQPTAKTRLFSANADDVLYDPKAEAEKFSDTKRRKVQLY